MSFEIRIIHVPILSDTLHGLLMYTFVMDYSLTVYVSALTGGKKKPLKAPKKQTKEMDDVSLSEPCLSS